MHFLREAYIVVKIINNSKEIINIRSRIVVTPEGGEVL